MKNPICVQDVQGSDGTVTSGQNLHAQLFAYQDNLYTTGIASSFNTGDATRAGQTLSQTDIENLIGSWGNHGYCCAQTGQVVELPHVNVSRNAFAHNYPDAKSCGMGGGNSIGFSWGLSSKYWRSTTELFNQAESTSGSGFDDALFIRWDEDFGRVGMYGDDTQETGTEGEVGRDQYNQLDGCCLDFACNEEDYNCPNPQAYVRDIQRSLRNPLAIIDKNTQWNAIAGGNTSVAGSNAGKGINVYYRDPEPMPKIYFQLQPQITSLTEGVGLAKAQVQFEIHIDIELMGQCPSVLEATSLTGETVPASLVYARRWINNMGWKIPIFYPIVATDEYTEEKN